MTQDIENTAQDGGWVFPRGEEIISLTNDFHDKLNVINFEEVSVVCCDVDVMITADSDPQFSSLLEDYRAAEFATIPPMDSSTPTREEIPFQEQPQCIVRDLIPFSLRDPSNCISTGNTPLISLSAIQYAALESFVRCFRGATNITITGNEGQSHPQHREIIAAHQAGLELATRILDSSARTSAHLAHIRITSDLSIYKNSTHVTIKGVLKKCLFTLAALHMQGHEIFSLKEYADIINAKPDFLSTDFDNDNRRLNSKLELPDNHWCSPEDGTRQIIGISWRIEASLSSILAEAAKDKKNAFRR